MYRRKSLQGMCSTFLCFHIRLSLPSQYLRCLLWRHDDIVLFVISIRSRSVCANPSYLRYMASAGRVWSISALLPIESMLGETGFKDSNCSVDPMRNPEGKLPSTYQDEPKEIRWKPGRSLEVRTPWADCSRETDRFCDKTKIREERAVTISLSLSIYSD
jgi:hypothetical protein